jgi:PTS system nitrogen regulatory IIA component
MELSLEDIARHLGVALNTVQRWVRQGKLPVQRKGLNYTFKKQNLKKWAAKHNLVLSFNDKKEKDIKDLVLPDLSAVIKNGGIYYNIQGDSVDSVLKSALDAIQNIPFDLKEELAKRLIERENVLSTGIGNGIAIPHPREQFDKLENSMLAICFLENEIEYNALDKRPVSVLFILLCKSLEIHLHVLSTLSFCLRDSGFVSFIKSAPDYDKLIERIEKFQNDMV